MAPKTNLKLASFDGGDIRGLSQLEIMDAIMHRLTWDIESNGLNASDLPCDHFDLMGGSGTGGLIAILLAKLRMSVEEASDEFEDIIKQVFNPKDTSGPQRTEALRKCMEDILKKKGLPVDLRLTEDKQEGCSSFVVASLRTNTKSTVCLRTYPVRNQRPSTITVIEAVLATCVTQPEFAPVSSGSGRKAREYIAASGALNPIHEVISEAHLLFGEDATVVSLLSIGAGYPGIISLPQGGSEAAIDKQ
ncbi:hypothetical protein M408DRAFT_229318 [Serendipita vermifera MAFF 305830]|uniref:PNPLA domain-containing protein n=1 Tax=Serendipita vermifera MAFF 305830 TaxID=933852 RepID=A0A0C3AZV4_SERVB|nr:hypothetical protein M408DRAFT_229318 [Serendipita vermifera MAFF 305830]